MVGRVDMRIRYKLRGMLWMGGRPKWSTKYCYTVVRNKVYSAGPLASLGNTEFLSYPEIRKN